MTYLALLTQALEESLCDYQILVVKLSRFSSEVGYNIQYDQVDIIGHSATIYQRNYIIPIRSGIIQNHTDITNICLHSSE